MTAPIALMLVTSVSVVLNVIMAVSIRRHKAVEQSEQSRRLVVKNLVQSLIGSIEIIREKINTHNHNVNILTENAERLISYRLGQTEIVKTGYRISGSSRPDILAETVRNIVKQSRIGKNAIIHLHGRVYFQRGRYELDIHGISGVVLKNLEDTLTTYYGMVNGHADLTLDFSTVVAVDELVYKEGNPIVFDLPKLELTLPQWFLAPIEEELTLSEAQREARKEVVDYLISGGGKDVITETRKKQWFESFNRRLKS